ncbi:MAG: hypothetical protein JW736_10085 [Deltaproteobacteria bacterium]|nr:hypothetical protein [Deltaproteobacteria bacterium]MBN2688003.1 hypothetical protein [Deltaproteobacteria bacterium]
MADVWKEGIRCCEIHCPRCEKQMGADDERILSVYDHKAICMECKKKEEQRPDYGDVSKQMIGQCMIDTELALSDPGAYCYHHFYPFTC